MTDSNAPEPTEPVLQDPTDPADPAAGEPTQAPSAPAQQTQQSQQTQQTQQSQKSQQSQQSGDVIGAGGGGDNTTEKDPETWVTGDEPMTGAQRSYLDTLARDAGETLPADLTKAQASEHIDRLQAQTGRGQNS